jgi:hypothetical protein
MSVKNLVPHTPFVRVGLRDLRVDRRPIELRECFDFISLKLPLGLDFGFPLRLTWKGGACSENCEEEVEWEEGESV